MSADFSFLIITYGENYLNRCINSIREFYKNVKIYIVDNNIHSTIDNNFLKNYDNIFYVKNEKNNYELGAIWFATKIFSDVNKFIILHNSIILNMELPNSFIDSKFMSFFKNPSIDYSPTVTFVEKKIEELCNLKLEYNKPWLSISGCLCIIETSILKELISNEFDKIYATTKFEAVGTEILFGYLISNIKNIENNSLFHCTLEDYMNGRHNEIPYLTKIGSSQGNYGNNNLTINLSNNVLFTNIFKLDLTHLQNLNDLYIYLITIIDNDIDIQIFLLNNPTTKFICPNQNLCMVINSIRHRIFTKKYFVVILIT